MLPSSYDGHLALNKSTRPLSIRPLSPNPWPVDQPTSERKSHSDELEALRVITSEPNHEPRLVRLRIRVCVSVCVCVYAARVYKTRSVCVVNRQPLVH